MSPDEDSESVCSSQDSGLVIEEGGGADDDITTTTEEDLEFKLAEYIDQLTDKKCVIPSICCYMYIRAMIL